MVHLQTVETTLLKTPWHMETTMAMMRRSEPEATVYGLSGNELEPSYGYVVVGMVEE